MQNYRGPVLEAIKKYSPAIDVLFMEIKKYALELIGDPSLCEKRSADECRQITDLIAYHVLFEMFSMGFDWEFEQIARDSGLWEKGGLA